MEVLNLIRLFWGWVFPYISRIHTAYTGEDSSSLGTLPKCSVIVDKLFDAYPMVSNLAENSDSLHHSCSRDFCRAVRKT